MKNWLAALAFCLLPHLFFAQKLFPPAPVRGEKLPAWAAEMYGPQPNVWRVDAGYRAWRAANPGVKTTFSQFYKKWRRAAQPWCTAEGFIDKSPPHARLHERGSGAGQWTNIGPFETFNTNTGPDPLAKSEQANVYCIDQSLSDPQVLYCGTEGAEMFKSTDRGQSWTCVSRDYEISSVTALEIHPSDPAIVLAGEGNRLRRSANGGQTWSIVLDVPDLQPNELLFNPADPQIALAATWKGLWRSTDGGLNWTQLRPEPSYDVHWKTDDPQTAFLLRHDATDKICRFYKSTDAGLSWTVRTEGWFFSDDPARNDGGARLAVTDADPNRLYAVLIGEGKAGDDGFIGIWRSNDAGETWTLPNGPAGAPFDDTLHPNMATIGLTGGYHQGFYNLGLDASDTNPDELLAGFLKLWRSRDGAASFECIGGYCGNAFNYVHPDCQEIEINGADVWMTSDGGVEYSSDFFETHYARNRGITSSDFWGFATGWNDDVLVGGRYHNGNMGWYEDWLPGECLGLGGGEAPTGYVNPGEARRTYYSDIGGVVLPEIQNGPANYFSIGKYPNESYYDAESGEMEWDPRCWNHFYVSKANILWKTTDGGATFDTVFAFPGGADAYLTGFEQSRSNPDVLYLFQRAAYTWDPGFLWKTTDGGATWLSLTLPPGYARRMLLTLSPEDENLLWVAYPDGADGQKIYRSANGGQSWDNLSTPALDGEHLSYLLHQGGTNGGVYLGTYRSIWYRNDSMSDWEPFGDGLPKSVATCILRPFYRDAKLRLGAYGKGIWESPFFEPSRPVAQPMVDQRETSCPGDTLQFDDYSMLAHAGATWAWQFPGGSPASSSLRNPQVVYQTPGEYDVTLTVTNPQGSSSKTVAKMVRVYEPVISPVPSIHTFENGLGNCSIVNPDNSITWRPVALNTCDPAGDTAYFVENFVYSGYGQDELVLPVNLDLTQLTQPMLSFRVAYAPYIDAGGIFIDSMKVLVSADCGATFQTLFRSGGEALSTTTSGGGPGNLYETEAFSPQSCAEWRDVTLDLGAFAGKYITIKFLSQSGYGNNLYLDEIALNGQPLVGTNTLQHADLKLSAFPNPGTGPLRLSGYTATAEPAVLTLRHPTGQVLETRTLSLPAGPWEQTLSLAQWPAGVYALELRTESGRVGVLKILRQ
ncbi:MAG: PKD domain-containing protein [Saprospiraceae bacterium]|nr:PKD domain-containing protein [Saprospiraceae bacterium]